MMESAIFSGHIAHARYIPKQHAFRFPFFMWYLDLGTIDQQRSLGRWFSSTSWALSRFRRSDYLGDPQRSLADCVKEKMKYLTGAEVTGKVFGLLNLRTAGLYFSPINLYYGFDKNGEATHFLAEVSNTPWNERHYYAHRLHENDGDRVNKKAFKVSPFNPSSNQIYKWKIGTPGNDITIDLGVHDERGHIFQASLNLVKRPFSIKSARNHIMRKPVMTAFIIAGIYWQALKIFLKGIPYIPYEKEEV